MKHMGRITALIMIMVMLLSSVAFASNLTLMPPTDSQKYRPLGSRNTTVYAVGSRSTYLACKINIDINEVDSAYLFINQNMAFNDKFDPANLSRAIKIDKTYIIENYVVFNMKDYKAIEESNTPNRIVVAVQKTDGTIEFSNILLIVVASGDMTVTDRQIGNKVVYTITEGYLPADPSTILLTANGENVPYYYNQYDDTVTTFVTSGKNNLSFEISDLKGAKASLQKTYDVSDILPAAGSSLTRVQLASLIYDIADAELPYLANSYADIDYIPYEMRTVVSALNNSGIMTEYLAQNMFKPNEAATQQMMADAVNAIAGRKLYTPVNPASGITLDEAIQVMLSALGEN